MQRDKIFNCPLNATLSVIGGKYKLVTIYHLIEKPRRFSELQRLIPQVSHKVLIQQLRELERDGVIHREVYPVVPLKTEYSLTEFGRTLIPILEAICDWGREYMSDYIRYMKGELEI